MARKEAQSEQMDPSTPTWYILCSKSLDQTKITSCNIAALTFTLVRPFCPSAARDSNCFSDIPLSGWLQTSPGLDKKIPSSPARPQPPRIGLTMFHESHLGLLPTSLPWQWRCQSLTLCPILFSEIEDLPVSTRASSGQGGVRRETARVSRCSALLCPTSTSIPPLSKEGPPCPNCIPAHQRSPLTGMERSAERERVTVNSHSGFIVQAFWGDSPP